MHRPRWDPTTAARRPAIDSATFFTTMVDFESPGELGVFIDEEQLALVEESMQEKGYFDGAKMAEAFNLLRANDLIWSFVINNYLMGRDPFPFDLLYWNSDSTRMPRAMHSAYLRDMYQHNRLREPGGISLAGVPIDLTTIDLPIYILSTREDHIAPWRSTYAGDTALPRPDPLRPRDVGTHRRGRQSARREQVRLLHRRACAHAGRVARVGYRPRRLLVARLGIPG